MTGLPKDRRYVETHEWAKLNGDILTVGITDFAQEQLSELTYVELPDAGDKFCAEDEVAVVESVKAASDIYAPMDGEIVEVNDDLDDSPELINNDPFDNGWLFKLRVSDPEQFDSLLTADEYAKLLPED